jgi:dTDP-4-dehydrorhamnose 3,5-epimerase
VELSSENKLQLLIPAGFAHGFSVLSEIAQLAYKCNTFYHRESEAGIRYDDPELNIDWQVSTDKAIVSSKDLALPMMAQCRNTFQYKG